MTTAFLVVLLLVTQIGDRFHDFLRTHQVWVSQNISWQKAPSGYSRKLSTATATVLYFGPGQKFGMLDCVLNKEGRSLTISHGDGLNVYTGEWVNTDALLVKYRLVSVAVEPVGGEKLPGPWQTVNARLGAEHRGKAKAHSSPQLIFNGRVFEPTAKLKNDQVLLYLRAAPST
jgi:hypothetical protein